MPRLLPVLILTLAPASGCLSQLHKFEDSMVYQPMSEKTAKWYTTPAMPSPPAGIEEVKFQGECIEDRSGYLKSSVYNDLHGWYAPAKNPRAVVLFCHGNGGNVSHCEDLITTVRDKCHVTVLAFDYSGYGRSDGKPSERTLYDDARHARNWLAEKAKVPEKDIILYGYSLGGGVAVELAARDGAPGLILDRTFTSLPDVAAKMVPVLPVHSLMVNQYDSVAKIRKFEGRLLQLHGDADPVVPYKLGRKLYEAANEPKKFVTISNGKHNDELGPVAVDALDRFFQQLNDKTVVHASTPRFLCDCRTGSAYIAGENR